jgi:hypothetical protein
LIESYSLADLVDPAVLSLIYSNIGFNMTIWEPLKSVKEIHMLAKIFKEFFLKIQNIVQSNIKRNEKILNFIEKSLRKCDDCSVNDLVYIANMFNPYLRMPVFLID